MDYINGRATGVASANELQHQIDDLKVNKQDKLKSGENVKTINNQSILGEGNISIPPTLVETTSPTTSTVGIVGQLYLDTTNVKLYICVAVADSVYTWREITLQQPVL